MGKHYLVLGVILLFSTNINTLTILQEIKARPNLSEAARIIEFDALLPWQLNTKQYTAFIPSNDAISQYRGMKGSNLIKYHLSNVVYRVQDLPSEINSDLIGNPKLFVSKFPNGKIPISGWDDVDYYINNAKIAYANINATSDAGYEQVLHIVDQVIMPTIPDGHFDAKYLNPNTKTLLSNPEIYGLKDEHSVSMFEERVKHLEIMDIFALSGSNTFFIPINQALIDMMDCETVYGHIVPNRVIIPRTVQETTDEFPSYSFTDNLKILIAIDKVQSPDDTDVFYVKSHTISSDNDHRTGTVLARIVHGNIPVKNGVIHLIDRPLMVVEDSIMSFLQHDRQLMLFYELWRLYLKEFPRQLRSEKADLTLFAPSNRAFEYVKKKNEDRFKLVKLNRIFFGDFIKLHIVPRRLTTDMIISNPSELEETLSNHRKLYFNINDFNPSKPIVSLDGAGVNATITTPNIATRNGVIHIIDRLLGVPDMTVREKLLSNPMLSSTAALASQDEWDYRLDNRDEIFTFFAPSNDAWNYIKREIPSAYKKLFSGQFSNHVKQILQKHIKAGININLDELIFIIRNGTIRGNIREESFQMIRGKIHFQAHVQKKIGASDNNEEYYVEWNGIQAKLIHPNIECVNGVVHVIDQVLMINSDVTVNTSAASLFVVHISTLCATLITIIAGKILH